MDLRKIKKLIELLEDSSLAEMEITEGENTVRLSRSAAHPSPFAYPPAPAHGLVPDSASTAPASSVNPPPSDTPPGVVVESPLVGTFFNSPSPKDTPYVAVGSKVSVGDTLCLIEAMKTFNQLEAETAGVITHIHKNNGEPVEYGEPLFIIASE